MFVLVNDTIFSEEEAKLKITDLAIQRGYGIFDFLKTVGGKPIFLEDHLDRFYSSAEQMRLNVKQNRSQLTESLYALIEKNKLFESGIRITLTGGYSPDGFNIASESNIIITQVDFVINRNFEKSIGIMTYDYQRQFASAKTLDYLKAIWLQPIMKERGDDDILYHDNGMLRECPRANFFMVNEKNEILTSKSNILKGVTRKHILKFGSENFKMDERELTMDDLRHAKEAFISSTTKNILPVTKIDGRILSEGKPGPITRALMEEFDRYVYG
ncbi:MAG: aminotransferase class IV family protein [Phormidesmis sp. FL-bin-119]|nr:aminotransferase class IV family protein [Pedobacter sp.]